MCALSKYLRLQQSTTPGGFFEATVTSFCNVLQTTTPLHASYTFYVFYVLVRLLYVSYVLLPAESVCRRPSHACQEGAPKTEPPPQNGLLLRADAAFLLHDLVHGPPLRKPEDEFAPVRSF